MEITQELAGVETLRGTKSEDLFAAVGRVLDRYNLSWEKMVGITTYGAPAMIGKKAGFATLVGQKVAECGGKVVKYPCILHQEQLCTKSIGLGDVVRDVIKIINCIRSKALSHCQFGALLEVVMLNIETCCTIKKSTGSVEEKCLKGFLSCASYLVMKSVFLFTCKCAQHSCAPLCCAL